MTDSELVRECLAGRQESFRALMDRYRSDAMAVAVNILANREDAEDACQEAFLKAYRGLGRFDADRSYKAWFIAVVSHHCLDLVRKRTRFRGFLGRFKHENPAAGPPTAPGPSGGLDFSFLRPLTPKERTALYLWAQEDYSAAEIAAVLECSPATASVHLHRARTKIRTLLKEKTDARP